MLRSPPTPAPLGLAPGWAWLPCRRPAPWSPRASAACLSHTPTRRLRGPQAASPPVPWPRPSRAHPARPRSCAGHFLHGPGRAAASRAPRVLPARAPPPSPVPTSLPASQAFCPDPAEPVPRGVLRSTQWVVVTWAAVRVTRGLCQEMSEDARGQCPCGMAGSGPVGRAAGWAEGPSGGTVTGRREKACPPAAHMLHQATRVRAWEARQGSPAEGRGSLTAEPPLSL